MVKRHLLDALKASSSELSASFLAACQSGTVQYRIVLQLIPQASRGLCRMSSILLDEGGPFLLLDRLRFLTCSRRNIYPHIYRGPLRLASYRFSTEPRPQVGTDLVDLPLSARNWKPAAPPASPKLFTQAHARGEPPPAPSPTQHLSCSEATWKPSFAKDSIHQECLTSPNALHATMTFTGFGARPVVRGCGFCPSTPAITQC